MLMYGLNLLKYGKLKLLIFKYHLFINVHKILYQIIIKVQDFVFLVLYVKEKIKVHLKVQAHNRYMIYIETKLLQLILMKMLKIIIEKNNLIKIILKKFSILFLKLFLICLNFFYYIIRINTLIKNQFIIFFFII